MKYQICRPKTDKITSLQQSVAEHVSMTLTFDVLIWKSLIVFQMCMKFQICRIETGRVIALQPNVADYVVMTLIFYLLT